MSKQTQEIENVDDIDVAKELAKDGWRLFCIHMLPEKYDFALDIVMVRDIVESEPIEAPQAQPTQKE
jgi:hypothetical protein